MATKTTGAKAAIAASKFLSSKSTGTASKTAAASAGSYHLSSTAPLPWCSAFSQFALVVK